MKPLGIKLSDIVKSRAIKLGELAGKTVAVDAHNALYMFLASIRTPDGSPLLDFKGRPVSHLKGLLTRTSNLLAEGIKPVFIFDGKPHPLKRRVLDERRQRKRKAQEEYEEALAEGDMERARTKAQQTSRLTGEMVEQSMALLDAMGIPWVQAPGEGEAQASAMAREGLVWCASSQDFDSLLFGAPVLVRNLATSGRRKLPGRRQYVSVEPELIDLETVLGALDLDREGLVELALMVGTDFNEGVHGIGPKKALKLLSRYGGLREIMAEKGYDIPDADKLKALFLEPDTDRVDPPRWGPVDEGAVKRMLCGDFGFGEDGVERALSSVAKHRAAVTQKSLDRWF